MVHAAVRDNGEYCVSDSKDNSVVPTALYDSPSVIADGELASLDDIAIGLQNLRISAGNISFTEIADRIADQRISRGVSAHRASISRSTVYDCFRTGRKRVNAGLVADIVQALTDDADLARYWRERCVAAQMSLAETPQPESTGLGESSLGIPQNFVAVGEQLNQYAVQRGQGHASEPQARSFRKSPLLPIIAVGVLVNLLPYIVSQTVFGGYSPLFLDMIGTAIVAIALGPLFGVVTAALSSVIGATFGSVSGLVGTSLHFAPVAIIGALIWGFGIHKFKFAASLPRFLLLNAMVGVACTLAAFAIIMVAFDGHAMNSQVQMMTDTATSIGISQATAVMITNLLISIVDKSIAGIIALVIGGTVLRHRAHPNIPALTSPLKDDAMNIAHLFAKPIATTLTWAPLGTRSSVPPVLGL